MIAIVQRVLEASVTVDGQVVGKIGTGLLVLAAVVKGDTEKDEKEGQWLIPVINVSSS